MPIGPVYSEGTVRIATYCFLNSKPRPGHVATYLISASAPAGQSTPLTRQSASAPP
jgi:hypothetical protein